MTKTANLSFGPPPKGKLTAMKAKTTKTQLVVGEPSKKKTVKGRTTNNSQQAELPEEPEVPQQVQRTRQPIETGLFLPPVNPLGNTLVLPLNNPQRTSNCSR
jgi:hypothetical protein